MDEAVTELEGDGAAVLAGDPLDAVLSLAEAARLSGLAAHTLTLQAERGRLHARKLIRVEHCEADGRKKRIWLTGDGKQAYAQAMVAIRPRMESLRDGFTQTEFREALPFLKALRTWLSEMHEEQSAGIRRAAE